MKAHRMVLVLFGACFMAIVLTGCGSLSLLSSRHVHYHGSAEVDKKVDDLAKRVEALEQAAKAK